MAIRIHTTSNRVVNKSDMLLLIPIATITITIRNGTNNRSYRNDSSNNSNESSTYKNPICWNNGEGSTSKQNWWYIISCFSFQPQKTVKQWPIAVGNRLTGHLKLASNNPWGCRLPTIQPFSVQVASPGWDSRCQSTGATMGLPPFFSWRSRPTLLAASTHETCWLGRAGFLEKPTTTLARSERRSASWCIGKDPPLSISSANKILKSFKLGIPSGKQPHNYGKSPCITMLLMGKSTISMAIFNSKLLVYQRVNPQFISSWKNHQHFLESSKLDNLRQSFLQHRIGQARLTVDGCLNHHFVSTGVVGGGILHYRLSSNISSSI